MSEEKKLNDELLEDVSGGVVPGSDPPPNMNGKLKKESESDVELFRTED